MLHVPYARVVVVAALRDLLQVTAFVLQEDVSHSARVLPETGPQPKILGAHRHRAGGQQALPVRVPQVVVASGRQSGSASPAPPVHAPRLAVHRRPAAQDVRVVRKSQTYQQRNGHQRTSK